MQVSQRATTGRVVKVNSSLSGFSFWIEAPSFLTILGDAQRTASAVSGQSLAYARGVLDRSDVSASVGGCRESPRTRETLLHRSCQGWRVVSFDLFCKLQFVRQPLARGGLELTRKPWAMTSSFAPVSLSHWSRPADCIAPHRAYLPFTGERCAVDDHAT